MSGLYNFKFAKFSILPHSSLYLLEYFTINLDRMLFLPYKPKANAIKLLLHININVNIHESIRSHNPTHKAHYPHRLNWFTVYHLPIRSVGSCRKGLVTLSVIKGHRHNNMKLCHVAIFLTPPPHCNSTIYNPIIKGIPYR